MLIKRKSPKSKKSLLGEAIAEVDSIDTLGYARAQLAKVAARLLRTKQTRAYANVQRVRVQLRAQCGIHGNDENIELLKKQKTSKPHFDDLYDEVLSLLERHIYGFKRRFKAQKDARNKAMNKAIKAHKWAKVQYQKACEQLLKMFPRAHKVAERFHRRYDAIYDFNKAHPEKPKPYPPVPEQKAGSKVSKRAGAVRMKEVYHGYMRTEEGIAHPMSFREFCENPPRRANGKKDYDRIFGKHVR